MSRARRPAMSRTIWRGDWMTTMPVTIFLCGDVMTGRGIDQILLHPVDPILYEPSIRDARAYVRLAEQQAGRIAAPVAFDYIWGEALELLAWARPAARLINLETSVTTSRDYWEGKGIHYRMHPANLRCLTSAGIDCCSLANNHALDWGYAGLRETLRTLGGVGIKAVGAGTSARQAAEPVTLDAGEGRRVLVFAYGSPMSGVPPEWAATPERGASTSSPTSRPGPCARSRLRSSARPAPATSSSSRSIGGATGATPSPRSRPTSPTA